MPAGFAELPRQAAQKAVLVAEVAARPGDLEADQFVHGEMLEQRDDVGERLVKGQHVRVRGFLEAPMQAVEQRMRHLMGDDVAGQAGEHHRARPALHRLVRRWMEIAEQQRLLFRAVIGVVGAQRVRIDAQLPHLSLRALPSSAIRRRGAHSAWRPSAFSKLADRRHRDCVDHLLMELRIAFRRRPAVLGEQLLVVEIDRVVDTVRGRVDVDHFQIFADRPWLQLLVALR